MKKLSSPLNSIKYTLEGYASDTVNCYNTNSTSFCLNKVSGAEISNTIKYHLKKILIGQTTQWIWGMGQTLQEFSKSESDVVAHVLDYSTQVERKPSARAAWATQ